MKTNDPCRSCVDCGRKACQTSKESLYPDYCLTKTASEEERNSIRDCYIDDTENNQIMNAAAKIQAETYGTINRVKETILFAQQMGYQKIGIATCTALLKESQTLTRILRQHGFQVFSACCKVGAIVMGLCVGHDILFHKYIQGPTTTLVVKDRVLAHNPAAALYTVHSFNKDLLS